MQLRKLNPHIILATTIIISLLMFGIAALSCIIAVHEMSLSFRAVFLQFAAYLLRLIFS